MTSYCTGCGGRRSFFVLDKNALYVMQGVGIGGSLCSAWES